jgi:archaeal flagellin FlaB
MIITAGVTASVIFQTMDSIQQQALKTSQDTIRDISTGIRITHISGYTQNSLLSQIAFFIEPIAGSDPIDLNETTMQVSDAQTVAILSFDYSCYSSTISNGLFGTVNTSNLSNIEFGILIVRDSDASCSSSNPIINNNDLVVLLVNTTNCFSGISTSVSVSGKIMPEVGISGVFSLTTPSSYYDTIVDLR